MLVRNRKPKFKVFDLLQLRLILDVYTSAEADLVKHLLVNVIDLLKPQRQVLSSELFDEHVELTCYHHACEEADILPVYWDLIACYSDNVVDGVQARDWLDRHEVCHMNQRLRVEVTESCILSKDMPILQEVGWQRLLVTQGSNQCRNVRDVLGVHLWVSHELCKVIGEDVQKLLGRLLLSR